MSLLQLLAAGRRAAEAKMLDTCTAGRPGEEQTDGQGNVTVPLAPLYAGRCLVQTYEAQESNPVAGGATLTVQRYRVDVPVGAFAPAIGDVIQITAAVADPHLAGRTYRVVALLHKSQATAYRLGVQELLGTELDLLSWPEED